MGTGGPQARRSRRVGASEGLAIVLALVLGLGLPLALGGNDGTLPSLLEPDPAYAAAGDPCGGRPMPEPDRVITGSFGKGVEGAYVMLPFEAPAGTDAVRVKYCHDQPLLTQVPGTSMVNKHTLDMGIYGPRSGPEEIWGEDEFRGWGGSSRPDVTISPEGSIDPDPPPVATTETTVGYRPGPVEPGEWAVELGVAAIGIELPGAEDGRVAYRVEIDLIDDPGYSDEPYQPVPYDETPANPNPGWYAGDFHVHARHSNPNDATMRETFDYAFAPLGQGAGLDFITLSDYVTDRAWGEIGAFQPDYPGKQIVRSAEVITYLGHINNHGSQTFVDYRTGPILERRTDGALVVMRKRRPAAQILRAIVDAGGWNQINHPEIFPADVPTLGNLCRGCSWEYADAQTDYRLVDAIEVATGPAGLRLPTSPGPNPFTVLGLLFYEHAIDANGTNSNHIAAVGSSDSHKAGSPPDALTAPIGQATTVVRAEELSEQAIGDAVRAGHTYVKLWGNDGADLRFEATPTGSSGPTAIMGDTLATRSASFTARVTNLTQARAAYPGIYTLLVYRNGLPYAAVPVTGNSDTFTHEFTAAGPARYRLQLMRLVAGVASIDAVSSPIYLQPGYPGALGG
ncbi:MAG: CehA/McbA family metallohydrolase [Solirubrobacterales bacterium]